MVPRVLLLLLLSALLRGEQPIRLSLDTCIQRALVHHPRLGLARGDLSITESLLAQAEAARFRPQMEMNAMFGPAPAARGSPYDPTLRSDFSDLGAFTRAEITTIQPIYTFGKLEGKADAAKHAVDVARNAQDQVASEVRRETRRLYYGVLLARELSNLASELLQRLAKARNSVQKSLESDAGQFSPADQCRLDLFSMEIEARRVAVTTSEVSALAALKATLGFGPSVDFDITDTVLVPPARQGSDEESATRLALTTRPEMRQLAAGDAARAALVRSARADLFPQIYAGAQARYGYAPNRTDQRNPFVRDDYNFFQGGFAVGFRYSLNFAATRAKLKEAEAEQQHLRAQKKLVESSINLQTRLSVKALEAAELTTDIRQEAARTAKRWLATAESNFNLGVGETRDLVDAFQAYIQTKVALLQAVHDEHIAGFELEYAKGRH